MKVKKIVFLCENATPVVVYAVHTDSELSIKI